MARSETFENAYHRNVLTVDASNHLAMRLLERHLIAHGRVGRARSHLLRTDGAAASDGQRRLRVHISSDRARLRQRDLRWQQGGERRSDGHNRMENDYRLALNRDRSFRPTQRLSAGRCRCGATIVAQIAEPSQWIGELSIAPSSQASRAKNAVAAGVLTRAGRGRRRTAVARPIKSLRCVGRR